MKDSYKNPIGLTQQFRFCGNPFRLDFYRFCTFGCKYCFARNFNGQDDFKLGYAKFGIVERLFKRAFETNEETNNVIIDLLRHKVPIHIGGMSDPFQPIEWKLRLNYKMIELSNKYDYPLIFSTKTDHLEEDYYKILNPKLHAFQISLLGNSLEYVRKYEDNTPSADKRIEFMKLLRSKGFWCSIRIQPIIDINEVIELCKKIDGYASYVTLEHLKVNIENVKYRDLFNDYIENTVRGEKTRELVLPIEKKKENIKIIKSYLPNTTIGVGDNDLHYLSESRCCCGVDTIGDEFNNYLKYNLTYFTTEHLGDKKASEEEYYIPKGNVKGVFNSDSVIKGMSDFKGYVDSYCGKNCNYMCSECSMYKRYKNLSYSKKTGRKFKEMDIFDILGE